MAGSKPRHYVIVVHGIGQQKYNETTTEVVHRFADVRRPNDGPHKNLVFSHLSAQSIRRGGMGHGWSEFRGIPVDPTNKKEPFDGRPATDSSGKNFRFVDLHWANILIRHQKRYATPTEKWATALLDRLRRKEIVPACWLPRWALPLLNSLVEILLPVKRLLSWRRPELAKLIFDDFLGDVHLYGDYVRTRGRAVRHFHVILDEILLRDFIDWCHHDRGQNKHNPYKPPFFTIIAHSLGTVLSFDSLVYAHAKKHVRVMKASAEHPCASLPFLGYTFDREDEKKAWFYLIGELQKELQKDAQRARELMESVPSESWEEIDKQQLELSEVQEWEKFSSMHEIPLLLWRRRIKSLVTLGSPIDKYHALWFQNYLHMGLRNKNNQTPTEFQWWKTGTPHEWLEPSPAQHERIIHYNLCDEQDPVGHHLDIAGTSDNYKRIFDIDPATERDALFRRYAVPGVAHVKYWEDKELFARILDEVIDGGQRGQFIEARFRGEDGAVYRKALAWAYFRIPFIAAVTTGLLLCYGILGWKQSGFGLPYLLALAGAVLLWMRPRPMEGYAGEVEPAEGGKVSWWRRWKLRRSVLAHLVAAAVVWRRILIRLSEGQETDRDKALAAGTRLAFDTRGRFWKRALWRMVVGAALLCGSLWVWKPWAVQLDLERLDHVLAASGFILSATYLVTMTYVWYLFVRAKRNI